MIRAPRSAFKTFWKPKKLYWTRARGNGDCPLLPLGCGFPSCLSQFCSYDTYGTGDNDARDHAGEFFTSSRSGGGGGGMSADDFLAFLFSGMFSRGGRGGGSFSYRGGNIFFCGGRGSRGFDFDDEYDFARERNEP
jgi:hypothetical protein